ncbi:MAG: transposase, partial [Candidatus Omnitrophota bacterium]
FKPFAIDVFKTGYKKLLRRIEKAVDRRKAKKVFIGLEPSRCYGYQLTRCLKRDFKEVYFINSLATASNRNQKMLLGLKTDDIDLCSIGDLLIRGECYPYNFQENICLNLQENTYWRESKMRMVISLKNQIMRRIDKIFPGLDTKFNKNKPLYQTAFETKNFWAVVDLLLHWKRLKEKGPEELIKFFKERDFIMGRDKAERFSRYLGKLLIVDSTINKDIELLRKDIRLLKIITKEIATIEEQMVKLVMKTPARCISGQIKGISDLNLAFYIGALGDINQYEDASKIFSKAGLCPKIKQSGNYTGKNLGIKKSGNKLLRTTLFRIASIVIYHEPYFGRYYTYLRDERKKPWGKAVIAVARKLNRVMFAMMKRQTPFNPPIRDFGVAHKPKELVAMDEVSPVLK